MLNVLVQADVYDPVTGTTVAITAASHDDPAVCHANGGTWWPAIAKLPKLQYDLFDGAFGNQITSPTTSLTLQAEPWANFGRYAFADARFRLWTGDVSDPANVWTLRFDGRVTDQPQLENGAAALSIAVDDRWLDAPLLATYAGTTGAEGPLAMKGQVKPLALGAPRYVPGTLIDSVNSVFQVSGYGAIQEFEAALERGIRFAAPIADYPTYAALVAATIPPGAWATAKAVGMARFGAPTSGLVSFLIKGDVAGPDGWARKPGQLIRRIALIAGGAGKIDDASLNALDAACPYNLSYYVDQQTTARQLIQQIAASVNAVAGVSWLGKLFVIPVKINAPALTLAADGSALPPVGSVQQIAVSPPFKKLAIGAERTWAVHALSDIAFTAELLPLGAYNALTIYREGNITDAADGSRFLYISTSPGAGHAPPAATFPPTAPAANTWWKQIAPPTTPIAPNGTALLTLINDAQADASEALDGLAEAGDDGKLTGQEKIQKVIPGNAELEAAWSLLDTQAAAVAGFTAVSSARATAAAARTAWIVYRDSLSPAWNNTDLTTAITRATYNGKLGDYRYAIQLLDDALRQYAQTRSNWSGVSNDNGLAPANNAGTTLTWTSIGANPVAIQGNSFSGGVSPSYSNCVCGPAFSGSVYVSKKAFPSYWNILSLDDDAAATANASLLFCWQTIPGTSNNSLYVNGTGVATGVPIPAGAKVLRLEYDGTSVVGYVDGIPYIAYSSNIAAGLTLYPKVTLYQAIAETDVQAGTAVDRATGAALHMNALAANIAINGSNIYPVDTGAGWMVFYGRETVRGGVAFSYRPANRGRSLISVLSGAPIGSGDPYGYSPGGWGFYCYWDGVTATLFGVRGGNATAANLGSWAIGDQLTFYCDNVNCYWLKNGTLLDTYPVDASNRVWNLAGQTLDGIVQDVRFGPSTDNLWANTGGFGRPADGATSDAVIVPVGNVAIVGNSITRTAGNNDYGAMAWSNMSIAGPQTASMNIHPSAAWTMVALDNDFSTSATSYADMFCVAHYNYSSGSLSIYMGGTVWYSQTIAAGIAGRLELSWDGQRFTVRVAGVWYWSSRLQSGIGPTPFVGKFWAFASNVTYTGLSHRSDPALSSSLTLYDAGREGSAASIWELRGSTAIYRYSATAWLGNAYSKEGFTGTAAISARFTTLDAMMVGISDGREYAGSADYGYIDYCIYNAAGVLYAYENGAPTSLAHSFTSSATVLITYDGVNVRYYVDGALKRTVATTSGRTFYAAIAGGSNGGIVSDIQFGAYSQNDWGSIGGALKPEDGADVTLTAQFAVDIASSVDISFEYTGTTASGVPKVMPVTATKGGTDVTTSNSASYTVTNFTGGCTSSNVTVDNTNGSSTKGKATIVNGSAAPGTFDWIMTWNGTQVAKITVKVNKVLAAAPTGSGSGSSGYNKSGAIDAGGAGVSSTSYVELGRVSNLAKAAGESIYGSFNGTYHASGGGNFVSRTGSVKLQYSAAGVNSWTDFGSAATGSAASYNNLNYDDLPGSVSISQSVAPANGNYDVRVVCAISSSINSAVITFEAPAPGSFVIKV